MPQVKAPTPVPAAAARAARRLRSPLFRTINEFGPGMTVRVADTAKNVSSMRPMHTGYTCSQDTGGTIAGVILPAGLAEPTGRQRGGPGYA